MRYSTEKPTYPRCAYSLPVPLAKPCIESMPTAKPPPCSQMMAGRFSTPLSGFATHRRSGSFPFDDNASWEKNAATLRNLHALRERVRALEKKQT